MFKCIVIFFGFTILNCQFASADNIDISTKFNRDTIAVEAIEPTGNGYRNSGEVFITDGFSGETPPAGGVNLPDPSDGFGELSSAGRNYRFGQYDSSNTTQFNTWIISFDSVDTINITNQSFSSFGVLYSAVGYNPQDNNNGTVTVTYTDLTEQTFVWDVADSNGDGFDNLATIALGGNSPNGMDLFNTDSNSFPGPNNRRWYSQEFAGLDGNKVVDSLTFSVVGVGDFSGDAEFGIYAVSATTTAVPVCASGGTLIEGTGEINDFNSTCGSDDSYWAGTEPRLHSRLLIRLFNLN